MKFSTKQLPSGKWGIYSDSGLLATVDNQSICETIMANLSSGRRDVPINDTNELYQLPRLRRELKQAPRLKTALPAEPTVEVTLVEKVDAKGLAAVMAESGLGVAVQGHSKALGRSGKGVKGKGPEGKGPKGKGLKGKGPEGKGVKGKGLKGKGPEGTRVSAKRSHQSSKWAKASSVS